MTQPADGRWWIPLAVLAVTAALYLPALGYDFAVDDTQQIVWSRPYLTWNSLPSYFTSDVWSYVLPVRSNYYRPIFLVWLMLNASLCGVNPALWHLSAIVLHLAATLLFYFLAKRLTGEALAAGAGALLFGVHPVHVEAVAWVSGATEPLFAIFAFGMLLCYLNRRPAMAWLMFALALLSKETAVVLPALVVAYEWLFPSGAAQEGRLRRVLLAGVPYAAIILLYLPLRLHALGSLAPMTRQWTAPMLLGTLPFAAGFYVRQLFLPVQYSLFYAIGPVRTPGLLTFYLPLLLVIAVAAALLWAGRHSREAGWSAALLVLPILPVLNLRAFSFDDFLHDRYLYVPSAGLCLIAALVWTRTASHPGLRVSLLLGSAVILSALTLRAGSYWKDNLAITTRAIQVAPDSNVAQIYYGQELARQKRCLEALPVLKRALAGSLNTYGLYNSIAQCYSQMEQYDEAANYLQDVILLMPKLAEPHLNLATVDFHRGRLNDAEAHIREALRLRRHNESSPMNDRYHFVLATILEAKGDLQGAAAEFQAELRENPDAEDVRDRAEEVQRRLRH